MAKSNPEVTGGDNEKAIAVNQLRAIVERIERLASGKADIAEDIAEVYAEAKGAGFDTKANNVGRIYDFNRVAANGGEIVTLTPR